MNRHFFILLVWGIASFTARGELTVIADLGGNSTAGYFAGINKQDPEPRSHLERSASPINVFPIHTPELTPGKVVAKSLNLPGMQPLFLIGDDDLSRRWLSQRRDRLLQLNAIGLVVNVASEEALEDLQKHAEGLQLLPVSGSDLAKRLGLSSYPLLLTEQGLEQ